MLEIKSVSKSFPGVWALHNVSFEIQKGEVHALMGENGAGKSTLMKILSGVYPDYQGQLFLDGKPLSLHDTREAGQHGIAIIHQELNLIPELTIAENIFLGREEGTRWGTLDSTRMHTEAQAFLERLNLPLPPNRLVKSLRVGEQQLVEVAKALSLNARLLILDEPTSALSETEIERLFTVLTALKRDGVTMIYISHKLDEIFQMSDRITVLRDGEYIGTRVTKETDRSELIRMMVGRPLQDLFPKETATIGEEILRVENLSLLPAKPGAGESSGRTLDNISFSLRRGEILGISGLMGAGRTELLETLYGVYPPHRIKGRIFIAGQEQRINTPHDAIRAELAFATEDRKGQSLLIRLSVSHNMTLAALSKFLSGGIIRSRAEAEAVHDSIEQLRVKTSSTGVEVGKLSGGNQQKVVLAKCLLTNPRVLMLDEPTRGIDVGAKAEIYTLISQLARDGAGILMVSSELPELLAMCDRILVFCEGQLTGDLTHAEATQERIMEAATAHQRARAA
ncbi:MAG: sugar ABC transporter ATP-binding protein [Abitibacteriaceae bacterium]|nr:sugar ABC transporter ATP-binding protein [Abditibacteriaceae bacterium]MBV9867344.1 sugar ABC transporter ATP-binding protein [Abditibacteriaceae bacterium]